MKKSYDGELATNSCFLGVSKIADSYEEEDAKLKVDGLYDAEPVKRSTCKILSLATDLYRGMECFSDVAFSGLMWS